MFFFLISNTTTKNTMYHIMGIQNTMFCVQNTVDLKDDIIQATLWNSSGASL